MNNEELVRLLDIAYYEGAINFLKMKKEKISISEERHKYDVDIKMLESRVSRLIDRGYGDIFLRDVLNSMLVNSRN